MMLLAVLMMLTTVTSGARSKHATSVDTSAQSKWEVNYDCDGDGRRDCRSWDYGAARCRNPNWCGYRYKFGDTILDHSCRCKKKQGIPNEYDCDGNGKDDCKSW